MAFDPTSLIPGFQEQARDVLGEVSGELTSFREGALTPAVFIAIARKINRVRGSAMTLGCESIADLIQLLEEVAVKLAFSRDEELLEEASHQFSQAFTSLGFMIDRAGKDRSQADEALLGNLNETLERLGGGRKALDQGAIDQMMAVGKEKKA